MNIIAIPAGPIETNAWLLINDKTKEAVLFDAPPQSYNIIKDELKRKDCQLKALFLTHGHWDHMLDTALFAADGIPVYADEGSREFIENPELMSDYAMPGLTWKGSKISNIVKNGEKLDICGTKMEIRSAPGHCPGSIIIYIEDIETAVTGDVIFDGSIGRTDLPGGSFEILEEEIINKIYTLPEKTKLCPGHGCITTVIKEKKTNPFVKEEI